MSTEAVSSRADAVRNRARILDAADEVFIELGVGASTALVAERANLGIGTVFRHFATKEELLSAVLVRHLDRFTDEARDLAANDGDGLGFFALVRDVLTGSERKSLYVAALNEAGIDPRGIASASGARFREALEALLVAAQQTGSVRGDVSVEVVIAAVAGFSAPHTRSFSPETRAQVIEILLDGFRPSISRGSA